MAESEENVKVVLPTTTTIIKAGRDSTEFKLINPATWGSWVAGLTFVVLAVVTHDKSLFNYAVDMFFMGAGLPAGYTAARTYLKRRS